MAGVWHGANTEPASPREATAGWGFDRGPSRRRADRASRVGSPAGARLPCRAGQLGRGSDCARGRARRRRAARRGVERRALEEERLLPGVGQPLGCVYYSRRTAVRRRISTRSRASGPGSRRLPDWQQRRTGGHCAPRPLGFPSDRNDVVRAAAVAELALASPQRLAALVRMQRGEAILAEALGRLPGALSARRHEPQRQSDCDGSLIAPARRPRRGEPASSHREPLRRALAHVLGARRLAIGGLRSPTGDARAGALLTDDELARLHGRSRRSIANPRSSRTSSRPSTRSTIRRASSTSNSSSSAGP